MSVKMEAKSKEIARDAGLHVQMVRRHLRRLKAEGLLEEG